MAFLIIGKTATDQLNASALAFLAHDDFEDSVAEQLSGGSSATSAKLAIRAVYYLVAAAAGLYLLFMMFQLPRDSSTSSAPDGGERSKRRGGDGDGEGEGGGGDGGGGGMLCTWWQGLRRKHGPMAAWNMMLWGTLLAYTSMVNVPFAPSSPCDHPPLQACPLAWGCPVDPRGPRRLGVLQRLRRRSCNRARSPIPPPCDHPGTPPPGCCSCSTRAARPREC